MSAQLINPPGASARPASSSLPIAGVIPFSTCDWPGKLTITAFLQGCPLRCRYCHNPALQPLGNGDGHHGFEEVLDLLDARRGLIDALVVSGGEPLAVPGLADAIRRTHAAGFPVGLHTSGYSPARLRRLLADPNTRPDWIGLDVKGLPGDLPAVAGVTSAVAHRMWQSLDIAADTAHSSGMGLQLRTTSWPGSVVKSHLPELKAAARARGCELVVQSARGCDAEGYYRG